MVVVGILSLAHDIGIIGYCVGVAFSRLGQTKKSDTWILINAKNDYWIK